MAETAERRSALAEVYRVGPLGPVGADGPAVTLSERRCGAIAHAAARGDPAAIAAAFRKAVGVAAPLVPNTADSAEEVSAMWLAPDRWMVVSDRHAPEDLDEALRTALDGAGLSAAVNDITSGRTVVRVGGPRGRDLLARGCPLDLHPDAFAAGQCLQSLIGHLNVLMHAIDDGGVDVYVFRGFGVSLWEFLTERAGAFGCEVLLPAGP